MASATQLGRNMQLDGDVPMFLQREASLEAPQQHVQKDDSTANDQKHLLLQHLQKEEDASSAAESPVVAIDDDAARDFFRLGKSAQADSKHSVSKIVDDALNKVRNQKVSKIVDTDVVRQHLLTEPRSWNAKELLEEEQPEKPLEGAVPTQDVSGVASVAGAAEISEVSTTGEDAGGTIAFFGLIILASIVAIGILFFLCRPYDDDGGPFKQRGAAPMANQPRKTSQIGQPGLAGAAGPGGIQPRNIPGRPGYRAPEASHNPQRAAQYMDMLQQREHQAHLETLGRHADHVASGRYLTEAQPIALPAQRQASFDAARAGSLTSVMSAGPGTRPPTMPPSQIASPRAPPRGPAPAPSPRGPHMCPNLVMPNNEAVFAISFKKLTQGQDLSVMGLSGQALLRMAVDKDISGRRRTNVLMPPAKSPTLASVTPRDGTGLPCEVFDGSEQKFGVVVETGTIYHLLLGNSTTPALWLAFDQSKGALNLHNCVDNAVIATASRADPTDFEGEEHMEIYVHPGVDGVLVLCCVFAITFPWK